jgi:PASTA domain
MRRLFLLAAVLAALGATATLTYAAGRQLAGTRTPKVTVRPKVAMLVVPDVRKEAFVFAKEQLQDGGFAWRVGGGARGYSANTVVAQSPLPGTRLIDTGAPLITLTLARNPRYKASGEPQDVSPYAPTANRQASGAQ